MTARSFSVAGLRRPVDVHVDRWGIPHVYGSSDDDLYTAQGFVTAMFRLWQMDLWRKRGLGLLASTYGHRFVEADRARRLLLYRGDMDAEWAAYPEGVRERVEAFVAGVNAFVERARNDASLMPVEFSWMDDAPALWDAADIVRIRSIGLRADVTDEIARTNLAGIGALGQDHVRRTPRPFRKLRCPASMADRDIPKEVLSTYLLAVAESPFSGNASPDFQELSAASNVWAIDPNRSATGRAILANDPHRLHGLPSVRWLIHLNSPEFSAIGATDLCHPGVSSGHNGKVAFGFTYSACDQEDLVIYDVSPNDPDLYFANGEWQPFQIHRELIDVKGDEPHATDLKFTCHGPVLYESAISHKAYALQSAFLLPGGAPYFAGVGYHRCNDIADFEKSVATAVAPTMNYTAADVEGGIGLFLRGFVPRRSDGMGGFPALGADNADWHGPVPPGDLPSAINPDAGWVANCNQVPPGSQKWIADTLGDGFSDATRYNRLSGLIQQKSRISVADCMEWQLDQSIDYARPLIDRLLEARPALPSDLLRLLSDWDSRLTVNSVAAGFFAVWLDSHLKPALAKSLAPKAWTRFKQADIVDRLDGAPPSLLCGTAEQAAADLSTRRGDHIEDWALGNLQSIELRHPLHGIHPQASTAGLNSVPVGGNLHTLNKAASSRDLNVDFGPSFRIIVDVGDWSASRAVNMPGQSGHPSSPHYRNMFELWRNGEYAPLLWEREDVEAESEERVRLVPAEAT